MNKDEVVQKYPSLQGLYIPETGEIIHWGKGYAITVQSPLDPDGLPFKVVGFVEMVNEPIEVGNYMGMGPLDAISPADQVKATEHYDRNFNGRFTKLLNRSPIAAKVWNDYRLAKKV